MNPLTINPLALLAGGALALVLGFGGGWKVNGWRLDANLEHVQAEQQKSRADQADAAIADLVAATGKIKAAAEGAHVDLAGLTKKLDVIRKDFRDAKPAPLPVDCRPDAVRVRELTAAADAVDEAIAGQRAGPAMPPHRASGGR